MTLARLSRLFAADGRCLITTMDHGVFGEASWLARIEDAERVLSAQLEAGPDAIFLSPGQAHLLQRVPGPRKPALVMRADVYTATHLSQAGARATCFVMRDAVRRAVALDAACIVASLLSHPGEPDLYADCLRNIAELSAACEPVGMPLMVELLVARDENGTPGIDDDPERIATLARQAVELGADVVKADPPSPVGEIAKVIQAAGRHPVIAGGGVKLAADSTTDPDVEIRARTAALIEAGVAGVAYGRNIHWAADPVAMTRALLEIVHRA